MKKYIIEYEGKEYKVESIKELEPLKQDIKDYKYILLGRYSFETAKIKSIRPI